MNKIVTGSGALLGLFLSNAQATAPATETTQWMNYEQLYSQLQESMEQTDILENSESYLLNHLKLLEQNTAILDTQIWGETMENLETLAEISQSEDVVGYAVDDIDEAYAEQFKTYEQWADTEEPDNYHAQHQAWDNAQTENIKTAMKTAQYHHQQFESEEDLLSELEAMSEDSDGQMKALQTNNQLTAQQVRQAQLARQLEMAHLQLYANELHIQKEKEAAQKAQSEKFYATKGETLPTDGARF